MTSDPEQSGRIAASRWWHAILAAVIVGSLILQLWLIFSGGADANSGDTGEAVSMPVRLWRMFSYFTIDSNIVVLVVSVLLVLDPLRHGTWWSVARLNALLAITITGLVFDIVLAPDVHLTGGALVATIGFHYIAPWAFVLGWLLFGPRPAFRWSTIPGAFILPVIWLIYIFTQGAFTDWYPYPFLDVTDVGYLRAVVNAILVVILGLILAAAFKVVDGVVPSLLRPRRDGAADQDGGPATANVRRNGNTVPHDFGG
ncbi:Pr6Pr family membrane protein [Gordonia sp. OPL2]|uniref:Pr6Pr family membrane protein n=1 Tax=Gordonia sp. OPL2 TaxID=2486274 RepID=UPI001655BBED|nr:Pr6Pr family membrane protein [Gordonia sp. OPL2]ROZ86511.1 hypothetical protein EEB19_23985 [Gordonia sp. OPL2]